MSSKLIQFPEKKMTERTPLPNVGYREAAIMFRDGESPGTFSMDISYSTGIEGDPASPTHQVALKAFLEIQKMLSAAQAAAFPPVTDEGTRPEVLVAADDPVTEEDHV